MNDALSIRSLLRPVSIGLVLTLLLVSLLGAAGLLGAVQSLSRLSDRLGPATVAHDAMLADMLDMEAAVQGWAQTGLIAELGPFNVARSAHLAHQATLRSVAGFEPDLRALVSREIEAADRWHVEYAEPRIARAGGEGRYFDPEQFGQGRALFEDYKDAHERTRTALADVGEDARRDARNRMLVALLAMALAAAAGLAVLRRTRRRLVAALDVPLVGLESVAHRLAAGDIAARATPAGPRELRAVARALNELAEAHERSVAVEERLRRDQEELDSAKDDFISNVSHELRTPLTTIAGYVELVAEEFEDRMRPHHVRMLSATQRNVKRLRTLIDDLLTLSAGDRAASEWQLLDLGVLATEIADDLRVSAGRRGIRIGVRDLRDAPTLVRGDRAQLGRAMANLVDNAVKYSHPDSAVEIEVADDPDPRATVVTVVDHGLGIPAAEMDRLGGRFYRASNAVHREVPGTGLGLRIAQTILDRHGGSVRLTSREGEGTRATLRVPDAAAAVEPARAAGRAQLSGEGPAVLLG